MYFADFARTLPDPTLTRWMRHERERRHSLTDRERERMAAFEAEALRRHIAA